MVVKKNLSLAVAAQLSRHVGRRRRHSCLPVDANSSRSETTEGSLALGGYESKSKASDGRRILVKNRAFFFFFLNFHKSRTKRWYIYLSVYIYQSISIYICICQYILFLHVQHDVFNIFLCAKTSSITTCDTIVFVLMFFFTSNFYEEFEDFTTIQVRSCTFFQYQIQNARYVAFEIGHWIFFFKYNYTDYYLTPSTMSSPRKLDHYWRLKFF